MMWMMGCNDGGDFDRIQDPFTGRKLRPLMPRPDATTAAAAATPPCFARIHGTDLLALNHHLAVMAEQNKRELNTQQVVVSSRWNPTPEQLQTLEELYRRGTRTPSAEQIQQITAQLRRYGKIEGKNVFYWFQNHKARERQKRRRHLESLCDEHQPHHHNNNNIQINETAHKRQEPAAGGNRTAFEVEQTKNWASLTNSSTTNPEKTGQRAAECKGSDGWLQFDEEDENDDPDETQQRRNATWQMMHLSCSSSISPTTLNSSLTSSSGAAATTTMEMHHHHHPDFINIFFEPYTNPHQNLGRSGGGGGGGVEETQTLQLFPLQSCQDEEEGEEEGAAGVNSVTPPYKFFEFLPVKN